MKIQDPSFLSVLPDSKQVIFAVKQDYSNKRKKSNSYETFKDECIILSEGISSFKPDTASCLTTETALWAYKHIRQRPHYWGNKLCFLKRIFRTTNMRIWQKQKEPGFEKGLVSSLLVMMIGNRNVWLGTMGDYVLYFLRGGYMKTVVSKNTVSSYPKNAVGRNRLGLCPHFTSMNFLSGDTIVLVSGNVAEHIKKETIRKIVSSMQDSKASLEFAIDKLLLKLKKGQKTQNTTLCVVKKIEIN